MATTLLVALLIFALRLVDVSMGTLRIIMLVRRRRALAGLLGFGESLTWVIAAGIVFANLDSPVKIVAYAGGFAAGTVLGSSIEQWLAMGKCLVRIVTPEGTPSPAPALRDHGHAVTELDGAGMRGDVRVAFTVIARRDCQHVLAIVRTANDEAFVTVEDTVIPTAERRRPALRK